jgi:hypothetical protein
MADILLKSVQGFPVALDRLSDAVRHILLNSQTKKHLTSVHFNPIHLPSSSSSRSSGNACGMHSAGVGLRFGQDSDTPDKFFVVSLDSSHECRVKP